MASRQHRLYMDLYMDAFHHVMGPKRWRDLYGQFKTGKIGSTGARKILKYKMGEAKEITNSILGI